MKEWLKKYQVVLICMLIITAAMYVFWQWNREYCLDENIDYSAFSAFGAFYGGVIGTIFIIIGAIIAYNTYQSQISAYKNQLIAHDKEQIESRFFELLRLHQDNVTTLKKNDPDIFNVYIKLIRTFQEAISKYNKENTKGWKSEDVLKLSYLYFFYGWTDLSTDRLNGVQIDNSGIEELNLHFDKQGYNYNPAYKDFGIYFRQLYQTVRYINNKRILSYEEKYEYIKTLRARINVEEQYLLFLNSLVGSGLNWELDKDKKDEKLITKYNLIKNIPKGFKQIEGGDFVKKYKDIYFEGGSEDERKKREEFEEDYS